MWELDYKESWAPKNWCFWTVALEKTLASPLDCKWPKQSILEEISPQCSLEGLMLKLKPLNVKNWLTGKDPDAGEDWKQEEKGTTEDEKVGRYHQHGGHEFKQAPGVGDGQGSLACYGPWGRKELDRIDRLTWTEKVKKASCSTDSWMDINKGLLYISFDVTPDIMQSVS